VCQVCVCQVTPERNDTRTRGTDHGDTYSSSVRRVAMRKSGCDSASDTPANDKAYQVAR
jgi:hypothetical protein